jgi:hypothetical protein
MNVKRTILIFSLFTLCVFFVFSCATIFKGTKQEIGVFSTPDQAGVKIVDRSGLTVFEGYTPSSVLLPKKSEYDVFLSMEGYQESRVHISKGFEPLVLGNIICGGVVGIIIDYVNGAAYKLEPEMINVTLVSASIDEDTTETYAVFRALDDEGQLKTMVVPLIKN